MTNLSPNEICEKGEDCFVEALESEIAREDEESLPSGLREKMSHFHQDCERNVAMA